MSSMEIHIGFTMITIWLIAKLYLQISSETILKGSKELLAPLVLAMTCLKRNIMIITNYLNLRCNLPHLFLLHNL